MREHSRKELKDKLAKKEYAEDVDINKLLDELEKSDYLSDKRFTESFIRYRVSRGQGKVKITNELQNRGVSTLLINDALRNAEVDWYQLARQIKVRKFGEVTPADYTEKTKQMRFLLGRGFDSEMIKYAVK